MKYTKAELTKMLMKNLQKYIEQQKKSPKTICKELNIPYPTFMQWAEERSYPPNERISILADYFNVSMNELIQENQQPVCEITYCKKCEFFCEEYGFCEYFNAAVEKEDFCSHGIQRLNL